MVQLPEPWVLLVFISTVGAIASVFALWKGVQSAKCSSDGAMLTQEVHVLVNSQREAMQQHIDQLTEEVKGLKAALSDARGIRSIGE